MAHGAHRQGMASDIAAELRHIKGSVPWVRRRREYARLAYAEMDVRRLDDRIDGLLDLLAQLCDYSGQFDAAEEFRELSSYPPEPDPPLRLVREL
jgi:hypothetical protein